MAQNISAQMNRNSNVADGRQADERTGEAARIVGDAEVLARDLAECSSNIASDALEAGRDYAERARVEAGRVYEVGHQKAQEAAFYAELGYEEATEMVRRRPAQALGIALGVGVLIGMLLARR